MTCVNTLRVTATHSICLDFIFDSKRHFKGAVKSLVFSRNPSTLIEEEPLIQNQDLISLESDKQILNNEATYFTYFAFVMMGIALTTTWSSISFLVSYWLKRYASFPNIWAAFLLGYNLPGLPLLFVQLYTDSRVEKRIGLWSSYLLRIGFTLAFLCFLTALIPIVHLKGNAIQMIIVIIFVGVMVGVGSGWLYAMGALFPPKCTGYILIGSGLSTLLILADTNAFPINFKDFSDDNIVSYFGSAAAVVALGLFIFLAMMATDVAKRALSFNNAGADDAFTTQELTPEVSTPVLLKSIWPSCLACFITNYGVVAAVSLITIVSEHAAVDPSTFPQIVLYTAAFTSLAGNELAILLDKVAILSTQLGLLVFSCIRILILPLMVLYSIFDVFRSDYAFFAVIGVYSLTGALATSKCYGLGATYCPRGATTAATYWMNIVLYVGVYLGAATPYWLPLALGIK